MSFRTASHHVEFSVVPAALQSVPQKRFRFWVYGSWFGSLGLRFCVKFVHSPFWHK